jgi:hypothetical protein
MIRKTPLLNEVFNDFDYLYKQLRTKQENDDIKGKKQKVFDIVHVYSEDEAEKLFNVLLSAKQKLKSKELNISYEEKFGRNSMIQITTYLYLTSSIKRTIISRRI